MSTRKVFVVYVFDPRCDAVHHHRIAAPDRFAAVAGVKVIYGERTWGMRAHAVEAVDPLHVEPSNRGSDLSACNVRERDPNKWEDL